MACARRVPPRSRDSAEPPAAPTNLSGTISGSPLQVTLNWTNNAYPPATQVTIERSTDSGFATGLAFFAVAGNAATYIDSTVVDGPDVLLPGAGG